MGIRHSDKVRRIVASAPNLRPDDSAQPTALFASVIAEIKAAVAEATTKLAAVDRSRDWVGPRRDRPESNPYLLPIPTHANGRISTASVIAECRPSRIASTMSGESSDSDAPPCARSLR
jgi:hypothetical protein